MLSLREYKENYHLFTSICLNVTNDCNLKCRYCMPGDTKILMADGQLKNIKDIQVGDIIFGFQEFNDGRYKQRKIKKTKVLKLSTRETNEILKITMQDSKYIYLTPEHPVLNGRGKWTEAKNLREKTSQIMSIGYNHINMNTDIYNLDYVKGYFIGMWLTDGMHKHYSYDTGKIYSLRLAVKDSEIIDRMKQYCKLLKFEYTTRQFKVSEKDNLLTEAIFSSKKNSYDLIEQMNIDFRNNFNLYLENDNWVKGFLAAVYDAEGHIDKDNYYVSISNSDIDILTMWEKGLEKFGFEVRRDSGKQATNSIVYRSRIITDSYITWQKQMELFYLIKPAVLRKTFDVFENSCSLYRNTIKSIEKFSQKTIVYNLETDAHTFIANGLAVHNCFVEQHPAYMTLDTAKAAVDFLHNNLKRKREITKNPNLRGSISFFGGEPMLCYSSIIVPLVQYIEETYPNDFSLGITTNGTLLNKKRIDFFKKHNINILLSIDGNKETQDYNRPCKNCSQSSFDLINKNIPYLLKHFPNTTFRMTVYEDTCDKLFDNILYAIEKGFKNIYFCPDSRHNFSEENCQKLRIELEKIFLYFTGCLLNNLEYPNIAPIDTGLKLALQKSIRDLSIEEKCLPREIFRCGLGTTAASIGPTGDIYACQEQTSQDSENNPFYIGNIYDGIDNEKHEKLLAEFRTLSPIVCEDASYCDDCSLSTTCYDVGCPSASKARFDNFFIRAKMSCYWDRMIAELAQGILSIENENIEKYLKRLLRIKEADCNGC